VREAAKLTVVAPPVSEHTKTARGDEKDWGANVETVAEINRHARDMAPAMAVAMLTYKAEEAGLSEESGTFRLVKDDQPEIAVGAALVTAGKTLRKAKRALRRQK